MTRRFLKSVGAAALASAVVAFLPAGAAGQDAPLLTPDGHPDLQGVWNFSTATPMERPEDLADQETLTAEGSGRMGAAARRAARRQRVGARGRPAGGASRILGPHLVRARPYALRAADLAGDRSAERTHPAGAAGGGGARGAAEPAARAARARPGRSRRLGALPARFQFRTADDAERLQQQRAALPDRRPRGHPQRDGAQRARHPARRPPAPAGPSEAVGRGFPGELGTGTRWSSRPETSSARPPCADRAPTCTWSNVSGAPVPTRWSTSSRSTIRRAGRAPGPPRC